MLYFNIIKCVTNDECKFRKRELKYYVFLFLNSLQVLYTAVVLYLLDAVFKNKKIDKFASETSIFRYLEKVCWKITRNNEIRDYSMTEDFRKIILNTMKNKLNRKFILFI